MNMNPLLLCLVTLTYSVCTNAQGALYPFGSAAGDTVIPNMDIEAMANVSLLQPFLYFNSTYRHIQIYYHGHLELGHSLSHAIAPFSAEFDYEEGGSISYQQYTTVDVLHNATRDINSYFPNVTFNATWVFVATWDRMVYSNYDQNVTATFQAVLISDGDLSFIFMNYGDISTPPHAYEIGYSRNVTQGVSLKSCFPNETVDVADLKTSSNINVPGRWVIPASLEFNFSCSYSSGLEVPTTDEPVITQADHVVGMRLQVSAAERLNETEVEEQILKPFREYLRQQGIDVTGIRLRSFYEVQP